MITLHVRMNALRVTGAALLIVLVTVASTGLGSQPVHGEQARALVSETMALESAGELGAFIDPIFQQHMDEYSIPGASFVMVRDGEVFLSRGYGVIGDDDGTPVDPERTIFDLGSVGKLFTATAVMQQVEQGNLDLDTDVNTYLTEVQVPDTYDEPITLRHLLTHTAGFDERMYLGMVAPGPDEIQPIDENLNEHMPPRIRPPGETNQYSNAGMTLAGHIVEEVSGQSFAGYIAENIFEPLGMERSTYDYPDELVPDMAIGHESLPDPATPMEIWLLNQRPAGGLRSTGIDITRFMIAHLDEGGEILEPETVAEMHQTQFRAHEGISGSAIGFIEHQVGDRRGLHHGGQWIGFSSLMYLLPDEDTGIFVSYNHGDGIFAQFELVQALLDRYFPASPDEAGPGTTPSGDVAGTYRWNRYDRHTFMQLPSTITAPTLNVETIEDGVIETRMSPELIPNGRWVAVDPEIYQQENGGNRIAFDFDDDGEVISAHSAWTLLMSMGRVPWYQSAGLHIGLLVLFLVTLLTTAGWPIARLYRRIRGRSREYGVDHGRARLTAGLISGLIFAFLIGTLLVVVTNPVHFFQIPIIFKGLLWLPIIAAVLTIPLIVFVARLWMHDEAPLASRVHLSLIAVVMVGLIPYLWYWGLLGFHY